MAKKAVKKTAKKKAKKPEKKTQRNRGVYRKAEFEKYALFTALPKVDRKDVFGFHTDQDFAAEFDLHAGTLTDWKTNPDLYEIRDEFMIHFKKHTANIIGKLAERTEKSGDAFAAMAFMKIVEGWSESSKLDITSKGKKVQGFKFIVHNAKTPDTKR